MAKVKTQYICQNCGYNSPRYLGRCPNCGQWNTLVEARDGKCAKHDAAFVDLTESLPNRSVKDIDAQKRRASRLS